MGTKAEFYEDFINIDLVANAPKKLFKRNM
jgi:hypothetical protein